ncbi:hypothetical protein Tco_1557896 [Tanacetum coccineum]
MDGVLSMLPLPYPVSKLVAVVGGEIGGGEVDGALWVCDGTQLGVLILHPEQLSHEQALLETMECPP